jgi:phage shock protein C
MEKRLYRIPEKGQLTGVAAGLAEYFEIDVTVVRVLLVVVTFLTSGLAVLVYFAMALILPVRGKRDEAVSERVNAMFHQATGDKVRNWLGIILILFGAWYLVGYMGLGVIAFNWGVIWSVVFILVGLAIVLKARR